MVLLISAADLETYEDGSVVPRPEEDRQTQAAQNERIQQQLRVCGQLQIALNFHCSKKCVALPTCGFVTIVDVEQGTCRV